MAQSNEMLPVLNEQGEIVGYALRSRCHGPEKLLHPVVHLHVVDSVGRILLQHRSLNKLIQPGKWDTAVGGHVDYNETITDALRREVREEIGLTDFKESFVSRYLFESDVEREMVHTYVARVDDDFQPLAEENDIDELRFFTIDEINAMIERGEVTPNFAKEFVELISPYLGVIC